MSTREDDIFSRLNSMVRSLFGREPEIQTLPSVSARVPNRPPDPNRAMDMLNEMGLRRGMQTDTALNRRLYEAVYPMGYDRDKFVASEDSESGGQYFDALARSMRSIRNEPNTPRPRAGPAREDAWLTYLGLPQQNNSLRPAQYRPSRRSEPNRDYFAFDRETFLDKIVEQRLQAVPDPKKPQERRTLHSRVLRSIITEMDHAPRHDRKTVLPVSYTQGMSDQPGQMYENDNYAGVMGTFSWTKGKDNFGHFISYYDRWDLDQNPVEGKEGRFGRPFDIYDRIYYDPNTFEPLNVRRGNQR